MRNLFKQWSLPAMLLLPVMLWCFWIGVVEIWQTYTSFWLLENALAAIVIGVVYLGFLFRYWWQVRGKDRSVPTDFPGLLVTAGFAISCFGLLLNNYFGGFEVVPPILAYFAIYCWLGFILPPKIWKRSLFVFLLFVLTLPILERLQKFVGFPLRLFTAKVVSFLLQMVGAGHVSKSTIIMTENHASSIDLPCSGVKSLYFGGIVLLGIFFLQQLKISIKSVGLAILFGAALILFNIWRVFSLVYVYGVLNMQFAGDTIHVSLGICGFVVSCIGLWWGSEYLRKEQLAAVPPKKMIIAKRMSQVLITKPQAVCVTSILLISTIFITHFFFKNTERRSDRAETPITFTVPTAQISELPFSAQEQSLFNDKNISFARKYVVSREQKQFSILLVKSRSARSYHDPELCLQGLGYRLLSNETVNLGQNQLKKLDIQTADSSSSPKASVYYWYVGRDRIITEYSERVWEELQRPGEEWVLVELAALETQDFVQSDLEEVFEEVTAEVKEKLLKGS